ncbi:MAG: type II toxin-antitoxin system VapC family toxin [Caulobacteraceae bacterium]|nr:type II toxin-antitoxin system VapC family toxin [Caulobacteraceae bacterium]
MSVVLDASALLASLLDEPGKDQVDAVINGAAMTTVNLAEVVGHFAKFGADRAQIEALLRGLPIIYVEPDWELALSAGLMRPTCDPAGLSLGDRLCLAQAQRTGARVLTADRAWKGLAEALGVDVELIR